MGQRIVILLTECHEENEQGEMGDAGERRLNHCPLMIGEGG